MLLIKKKMHSVKICSFPHGSNRVECYACLSGMCLIVYQLSRSRAFMRDFYCHSPVYNLRTQCAIYLGRTCHHMSTEGTLPLTLIAKTNVNHLTNRSLCHYWYSARSRGVYHRYSYAFCHLVRILSGLLSEWGRLRRLYRPGIGQELARVVIGIRGRKPYFALCPQDTPGSLFLATVVEHPTTVEDL